MTGKLRPGMLAAFASLRRDARGETFSIEGEFADLRLRAMDPQIADVLALARSPLPELDDGEPWPVGDERLPADLVASADPRGKLQPVKYARRRTIRVRPAERVALTSSGEVVEGGYARVEQALLLRQENAARRPRTVAAAATSAGVPGASQRAAGAAPEAVVASLARAVEALAVRINRREGS